MSLIANVTKIDESKESTEDNLKVQILFTGLAPMSEKEIEKTVNYIKGVISGRIKTRPLTQNDFENLQE